MTDCHVFFSEVAEDGSRIKLISAWIYWRPPGASHQVLWSDERGLIFSFLSGDRTRRDAYTVEFVTSVDTQVEVFYSRGDKPLPDSIVSGLVMRRHTVPLSLPAGFADLGPLYVAPGGAINSVRRLPIGEIRLPIVRIELTEPADEPNLVCALWENLNDPDDEYYSDGIEQGAAWFGQSTKRQNGVAATATAAKRPRVRGIAIRGRVPAGATGATIRLFNSTGTAISLLQDGSNASSTQVTEVAATMAAPNGPVRDFSVIAYLPQAAYLGPVQIVVDAQGVQPAMVGAFAFHLVGAQLGVVDDFDGNPNGQTSGPVRSAADEVYVLDFRDSPSVGPRTSEAATQQAQRGLARVRRLITYGIRAHHQRTMPLAAVANPPMPAGQVQLPVTQMPFFMAELQLLGVDQTQLEDLMVRRLNRSATGPNDLTIGANWSFNVSWNTPDRARPSAFQQPPFLLTHSQTVALALDTNSNRYARKLTNVSGGVVSGAMQPAQQALGYPIAGRRQETVRIASAGAPENRAWGRHGGTAYPSLIIQWQPALTSDGTAAGTPIVRGGDGQLRLDGLTLSGAGVNPGLVFPRPTPTPPPQASAPPPSIPIIALPRFRLPGHNPQGAQIDAIIVALVEDVYRQRVTGSNWLQFLTLAIWQQTALLVVGHESGRRQYETRGGEKRFRTTAGGNPITLYYGHELDMPLFGGPHGYGMGQLDPPGNADRVWDIEANARRSVEVLLLEKGRAARDHLGVAPGLNRRMQAIFHRETVRRYNGGTEFRWDSASNDWVINPSVRADPGIFYPDSVLRTTIQYERLISAPNSREPAPASHAPLDTQLVFPQSAYFPGI